MKRYVFSILTGGFLVMFLLAIMVTHTMGANEENAYVGSETCALCHRDIADSWQETPHAKYVREATHESVVGDFTQSPTLSDAGAGIPPVVVELGVQDDIYTVKVGETIYTVDYAFGGLGWKQRYLTKLDNSMYILPIQWNLATQEWVPYHLGDWYDTSGAAKLIAKKQAWDRRCAGCHATGNMPVKLEDEFVAQFIEDSIGCEACHGPGKEHASTLDKTKIVNPRNIENFDRQNEVCGQCHLRGTSNLGTYGYPYDENVNENFRPGDDLTTMFIDGGGYWPDGTSKRHHQQWLDWRQSKHNDNPFHRVGCIDCHDMHGTTLPHNVKADPTSNELCLSCHGEHGFEDEAAIMRHTNHPVDPVDTGASRCIECHMPFTAKSAIPYDIRSHTFKFLSPEHGIQNEMPDSCTGCHDGVQAVAMTQQQAVVEFGTSFCTSCHSETMEYKEWITSKHSESLPGLRTSDHAGDYCLVCHSVDYILASEEAKPTVETARESLTCAVCHSHDAEHEHYLLQPVAEVCVACHTMGEEAAPGSTPHHAQIEVIKGTGGVGVPDMEGGHSKVNPEICVTCHMYREEAEGEEAETLAMEGGHTFEPSMASCLKCHGDPQPLKEQVQTEITALLDGLEVALDSYPDKEAEAYQNAKFNRDVIVSEGSMGIHNYSYAKALLTYAYSALGEPIPDEVVPTAGEFTISLVKGLNMISLPLQPDKPYTARSFAERLNATVVITFDKEKGKFIGFTSEHIGDGFTIEGGEGYIVNLKEAMEMTFSGTMWTNAPSINTASDAATSAWAFIVSGFVYDERYKPVEDGKYLITVKNLRTGDTVSDRVSSAGNGQFAAVWVDMSRQSVVEIGDKMQITVTDASGRIVSGPMVHQIDVDDTQLAYTKVALQLGDIIPEQTLLAQNYPNPFNPETWLPYQLAEAADNVTVRIFDAQGRVVRTLYLGHKDAGMYMKKDRAIYWNGKNDAGESVANGVYFYQLQAGSFVQTKKMVLLK